MLSVMRLPMSVLLATGATPSRVGNDHLNIAPYQPLRAKDGLIIVAVANPALWIRFCEAMERPDWRDDPRFKTNTERVANRDALKEAIEAVFAAFTVEELTARFQAKNVPCGRVRSIGEALEHPQVGPRDILLAQEHPADRHDRDARAGRAAVAHARRASRCRRRRSASTRRKCSAGLPSRVS